MTRHKLKLKRTPVEEEQRRLKKERRRAKKRKWEREVYDGTPAGPSSKRVHRDGQGPSRKWASSDEDEMEYGPQPATSSPVTPPQKYDALKVEIEERMFREKMFDALGDDERLDSVEARFNDFAQVPERWRTSTSSSAKGKARAYNDDELLKLDPQYMDEEEYAEWIRAGMYRKTHADEYAEQQRKKAAQAARRAEEKACRAETARMEKVAEKERQRKKRERESRRLDYAREEYNARWATLLATTGSLGYDDIPWPIAAAHQHKADKRHCGEARPQLTTAVEDLTAEAISSFLLPVYAPPAVGPEMDDAAKDISLKKERKDRLREAILRFHPDKFEGRFMRRINEKEKEGVREAIGQISRVLNSLMGDGE